MYLVGLGCGGPLLRKGHKLDCSRTHLARVPALDVAGIENQRIFCEHLSLMDVTQQPGLVPLGAQSVDIRGSVGVVPLMAAYIGMEQAYVNTAVDGVWISGN
jgi:hypothetical protein